MTSLINIRNCGIPWNVKFKTNVTLLCPVTAELTNRFIKMIVMFYNKNRQVCHRGFLSNECPRNQLMEIAIDKNSILEWHATFCVFLLVSSNLFKSNNHTNWWIAPVLFNIAHPKWHENKNCFKIYNWHVSTDPGKSVRNSFANKKTESDRKRLGGKRHKLSEI